MRKIKTMFLIILTGFVFTACGKTTEFTITYDSNGGSDIAVDKIEESETITIPEDPTKDGYIFAGWYSDEDLTVGYSFKTAPTTNMTLYAKWLPALGGIDSYNVTYVLNGGVNHPDNPIEYSSLTNLVVFEPTKEGYTFEGWYIDASFQSPISSSGLSHDVTLYAKWSENALAGGLATETLPIHSNMYGNTNGNLNNRGLALYDTNLDLHYYSYGSSIYAYNPATKETTLVCTLSSGGRATYLNLDHDMLYFIDGSNGYLLSYDLINHTFKTISDKENVYASRTQMWVNFIYPQENWGTTYLYLQRFYTDDDTYSGTTSGITQMNIDGTRVYYKPETSLDLTVMNYSGNGRSTIVYLANYDVEIIHESLLIDVDDNYEPLYALILTIGDSMGLYTYHADNGLVKIMDASGGGNAQFKF